MHQPRIKVMIQRTEVEHIFDKFLKYHMKILLGNFNVKVWREDIFKPTIGNKSLHDICNDNGVRIVNFATSKNCQEYNVPTLLHS